MKTLTEFTSQSLKAAAKTQQELTAAGKTAEELPAALSEALKVEGDKLTRLLAAVEVVGEKYNDLKRVLVLQGAEGEKPPTGGRLIGELYYVTEYYASSAPKRDDSRDERGGGRGGRDGRRGGGRDDKKKGGRGGAGDGRRGPAREDRGPRAPQAPVEAKPPGFKITPKAGGSAPQAAPAAEAEAPKSE
jgi:hypothetical protein